MKTLRSDKGICVNNLTISVITYQWDGQQVRDLAKGLAKCLQSGHSASYYYGSMQSSLVQCRKK